MLFLTLCCHLVAILGIAPECWVWNAIPYPLLPSRGRFGNSTRVELVRPQDCSRKKCMKYTGVIFTIPMRCQQRTSFEDARCCVIPKIDANRQRKKRQSSIPWRAFFLKNAAEMVAEITFQDVHSCVIPTILSRGQQQITFDINIRLPVIFKCLPDGSRE